MSIVVCTQLLVGTRADGECVGGYLQLLDRSLSHQVMQFKAISKASLTKIIHISVKTKLCINLSLEYLTSFIDKPHLLSFNQAQENDI